MSISPFTCYIKVAMPGQITKWEGYWLQIHGFWLIITKKIGQHCHFLVPLDLVKLVTGERETGVPNSLLLETSPASGAHKFYISSTSRIETILLFQALNVGCNVLKNVFQAGKLQEDAECDYQQSTRFSKQTGKLVLTKHNLVVGSKEVIPIEEIISMSAKQNDQNCHNRLVVVTKVGGTIKTNEYHVTQPMALMKITSSFLMHVKAIEIH